jgi:hypothetical protein
MRLVGTTKSTIQSIRDRTHWNTATLAPIDPVALGLCSQLDLDFEVNKASKNAPPRPEADEVGGQTLLPAEITTAPGGQPFADFEPSERRPRDEEEKIDADSVFAKLKNLRRDDDE